MIPECPVSAHSPCTKSLTVAKPTGADPGSAAKTDSHTNKRQCERWSREGQKKTKLHHATESNWSHISRTYRNTSGSGRIWLTDKIRTARSDFPYVPTNGEGLKPKEDYTIDDLHFDQSEVVAYILREIKKWMDRDSSKEPFATVCLTVKGPPGSGKTALMKTLTSIVRRMFNSDTAAHVCCRRGAYVQHTNGCTFNDLLGHDYFERIFPSLYDSPGRSAKDNLLDTVLLQIPQMNGWCCEHLAAMEDKCRNLAHGGYGKRLPWGGVPIIVLYGDERQPCYSGFTSIPIPCYGNTNSKAVTKQSFFAGRAIFSVFARNVMDLAGGKVQQSSNRNIHDVIHRMRTDGVTKQDVSNTLRPLVISNSGTRPVPCMELCTTLKDERRINQTRLVSEQSLWNPAAEFKAIYSGNLHSLHFADTTTPCEITCCVGAWVEIAGVDLYAPWGLHIGGRGRVVEINFTVGERPCHDKLPRYVVVYMPGYTGPTWDRNNPKHVPIPVIEQRCRNACCKKAFLPLKLSYARTGLMSGGILSQCGHNGVESFIVDIGTKTWERMVPGYAYYIMSSVFRASNGGYNRPAIFLRGRNVNTKRLQNMSVPRKDAWVKYLDQHTHASGLDDRAKRSLFQWSKAVCLNEQYTKAWIVLNKWQ